MPESCKPRVRLPSASKLQLLVDFCNHYPLLPWDEFSSGEAADTGKLIHSMIECEMTGGSYEVPGLADVDEAKKKFARFWPWWEKRRAGRVFWPEPVFLYNANDGSARVAEDGWLQHRSRLPEEVPCIMDAIHVDGDHAVVYDWKTGKKGNVVHASSNVQVAVAALCAHRVFNVSTVEVGLVFLFQRKDPEVQSVTLDTMDILDFENRLRGRTNGILTSSPHPGDWCFRCPAKGSCPARGGAREGVPGLDFPDWM